MNNFNKGNIFLLELVVDFVQLNYDMTDCPYVNEETCVTFSFLNNGPICVRENEFKNQTERCGQNDYIKYGKSCLFSLSPARMAETFDNFNVDINVYNIIKTGCEPNMVLAGKSAISLLELYHELMGEMYAKNEEGVISKTLDGCFDLLDNRNSKSGQINLFMRISCFGKVLVSNIEINVTGDQLENPNGNKNGAEPHAMKPSSRSNDRRCMMSESTYAHPRRQKVLVQNKHRHFSGSLPKTQNVEVCRYHCVGRRSDPEIYFEGVDS